MPSSSLSTLFSFQPRSSSSSWRCSLEAEHVGEVVQPAQLAELADRLLAEALDVERAPRREVDERGLDRGSGSRRSRRSGGPRPPGARAAAPQAGQARRHAPRLGALAGARPCTLPTTSGITSPARRTMTVSPTRTSLASTWISLWSVALVIVTPATATGSSTANGRGLAGAADVDLDGAQDRLLLDRRHLVGDGPARRLGRGAERAPLRHVVDLDDDAVDLEAEGVALLGEVLDEGPHLVDVVDDGGRVGHGQPGPPRPVEELRVGGERAALEVAEPVDPHGERPLADLARILLAQGARRRVARVHERRLAPLDALLVHLVELLDRVVHLAADLDDVGRIGRRPGGRARRRA